MPGEGARRLGAYAGTQVRPPSEVAYCDGVTVQSLLLAPHARTVTWAMPSAALWKLTESGEAGSPDIAIGVTRAEPDTTYNVVVPGSTSAAAPVP